MVDVVVGRNVCGRNWICLLGRFFLFHYYYFFKIYFLRIHNKKPIGRMQNFTVLHHFLQDKDFNSISRPPLEDKQNLCNTHTYQHHQTIILANPVHFSTY